MLSKVSCLEDPIVIDGEAYEPVRYGTEPVYRGIDHPCGDCCAPVGGVHHHGCDVELCPRCGQQSISCECVWDGEEEEEEDDDDWLEEIEALMREA